MSQAWNSTKKTINEWWKIASFWIRYICTLINWICTLVVEFEMKYEKFWKIASLIASFVSTFINLVDAYIEDDTVGICLGIFRFVQIICDACINFDVSGKEPNSLLILMGGSIICGIFQTALWSIKLRDNLAF